MSKTMERVAQAALAVGLLCLPGCGASGDASAHAIQTAQELEKLRAENQEAKRLRAENQELDRLRKDNLELPNLRGLEQEIRKLRAENEALRSSMGAAPTGSASVSAPQAATTPAEPEPAKELQPIENLPQAFEEAAAILASQGNPRPEDLPQKGDNLLIDQSVIGLLIPDFAKNTNSGPYEVSGWLSSRGVTIKNYQQLNLLGLTNYQVRRAPPSDATAK